MDIHKRFFKRDIISINDLCKDEIEYILQKAEFLENSDEKGGLLKQKVMASLFFEPSTRTKDSFITACLRLGGTIVGFDNAASTSLQKGESLYDTIKMYEQYADVIVMRHKLEGAARFAAESSSTPVINGGDGANQHPTQTLLDLYSIMKTQGKIENLDVALAGDLKYGRTVHSLAMALSLFGCRLYFVSPESLRMPEHFIDELSKRNVRYSEHTALEDVIDRVDVLYMTRIQAERFPDRADYEKVKNAYRLEKKMLITPRENMKIMHPLPRVNEIAQDVDETPYAYYFQQAANGVPVRQALLSLITGALS